MKRFNIISHYNNSSLRCRSSLFSSSASALISLPRFNHNNSSVSSIPSPSRSKSPTPIPSRRRLSSTNTNFIARQKPGVPQHIVDKQLQQENNTNNSQSFLEKKKKRSGSPLRAPKIPQQSNRKRSASPSTSHSHQNSIKDNTNTNDSGVTSSSSSSNKTAYFDTQNSEPLPPNQCPRTQSEDEQHQDQLLEQQQQQPASSRSSMTNKNIALGQQRRTMSAALAEKKEHDKKMLLIGTELMSDLAATTKAFDCMDPDTRRYIVVAAASEEWFGTPEVKSKLKEADALSDQRICATDYEQWIAMSMRKRLEQIPRPHFWTLVAFFGAPFFAMGFLDNCVFIVAGDVFDHILWTYFGVTGMICAGFGGIVAGTVGLQVHGVAARLISRTVSMPETTSAQRGSKAYSVAKHWGGVMGLVFGLACGMFPLLFLNRERVEHQQQQQQSSQSESES